MNEIKRGFTLVEIMIVVVIITGLVLLVVPSILRSRRTANEGVAIANVKTIVNACHSYSMTNQAYPDNLADFIAPNSNPPYIDEALASGSKQGYQFVYILVDAMHFTLNANPTGFLGGRYFFADETGVVRVNPNNQAGAGDEVVG